MAVLAPPAGSLNVPLTVEEHTSVRTSGGTTSKPDWVPDVIKWPANIKQVQGEELFEAEQIEGMDTYMVTGRYRPGLTRRHRFRRPDGTILNILSVNNVEERNVTMIVRCREKA